VNIVSTIQGVVKLGIMTKIMEKIEQCTSVCAICM